LILRQPEPLLTRRYHSSYLSTYMVVCTMAYAKTFLQEHFSHCALCCRRNIFWVLAPKLGHFRLKPLRPDTPGPLDSRGRLSPQTPKASAAYFLNSTATVVSTT